MQDMLSRPNRIPWPPLIVALSLAAGYLLDWTLPFQGAETLLASSTGQLAGSVLFYAGLALDLSAMVTMFRARTNILPHRAANKLVTSGPFALSRNPIYVGNTVVLLGLAFSWSNIWLLGITALATLAVDRLAIRREERHLLMVFGDDYKTYMAKVPRWVGLPK